MIDITTNKSITLRCCWLAHTRGCWPIWEATDLYERLLICGERLLTCMRGCWPVWEAADLYERLLTSDRLLTCMRGCWPVWEAADWCRAAWPWTSAARCRRGASTSAGWGGSVSRWRHHGSSCHSVNRRDTTRVTRAEVTTPGQCAARVSDRDCTCVRVIMRQLL